MTRILLVNASPHGEASPACRLAKTAIATLPGAPLTTRDLGTTPLPPISHAYAHAITSNAAPGASAFAWSETLIAELEQQDLLVIATPMHNFTLPAALKLWLDHVIRIHRSFRPTPQGKTGLMPNIPTFILISSGGFHTGPQANQEDFLTPYLRYALSCIGIRDVHFFTLQGMAFGKESTDKALSEIQPALLNAIKTTQANPPRRDTQKKT